MTDHLETTLRDTLVREAGAVPVPEDPWSRFDRREGQHRRARRLRVGAVAAVLTAVVGVQTNLIPVPFLGSGLATTSPWSALAEGPTRGSLATDTAWLAGFRAQIKGLHDPEGL